MARPQVSVLKRQREQAKREKKQMKAERRAQRKLTGEGDEPEIVAETPLELDSEVSGGNSPA